MANNEKQTKQYKRIVYIIGIIGSIASIVGLAFFFLPNNENASNSVQIQSGENNIQVGRDIIVNHNGESSRDDGMFLYEEKIEMYWNEWWAHPLGSKKTIKKYGQAEITIMGEGKTVDFSGIISMNCSNGKYYWRSVSNFGDAITDDIEIKRLVPDQIRKNIYKLFCRER